LFVNLDAVTPQEYKDKGKGVDIEFGFHPSPFGECMIAMTNRGICGLSFIQAGSKEEAFEELSENWEQASLKENRSSTRKIVEQIFSGAGERKRFNLLVRGTNFQIKVWEALLKIPYGGIATYQDIATSIDQPGALQAVGSAIGHNQIAYLIPCHRVIRKQGGSGEYRWGKIRKKSMIAYEMSKSA
jgi:AraC family transcriptional regulator, regulatory protein of adaptative response / methylated-DNA-[protein]-cysteine methyltransferase